MTWPACAPKLVSTKKRNVVILDHIPQMSHIVVRIAPGTTFMPTRDEFCKLTGLPLEALKSRTRRGQMPFDNEGERKPHGYSLFDAFLTHCALRLGGEPLFCHPTAAASIVRSASAELEAAWPGIWTSGWKLHLGRSHREIVWTRIWVPGQVAGEVFVGTARELSEVTEELSALTDGVIQSASRAAALMITFAEQNGVEVPREIRK